MISCHFGNTCPAPRAGQPLCCPELSSKVFQNKRAFYPSRIAGSTWSGCSPREETRRVFYIFILIDWPEVYFWMNLSNWVSVAIGNLRIIEALLPFGMIMTLGLFILVSNLTLTSGSDYTRPSKSLDPEGIDGTFGSPVCGSNLVSNFFFLREKSSV